MRTLAVVLLLSLAFSFSHTWAAPAPVQQQTLSCFESGGPFPLNPGEYSASSTSLREALALVDIYAGVVWPSCGPCDSPPPACQSMTFTSNVSVGTFYNPVLGKWFVVAEVPPGASYYQFCDLCIE